MNREIWPLRHEEEMKQEFSHEGTKAQRIF
jgi:hypothetical protein